MGDADSTSQAGITSTCITRAILPHYVRASVTAKQHMEWIEVAKEARDGRDF